MKKKNFYKVFITCCTTMFLVTTVFAQSDQFEVINQINTSFDNISDFAYNEKKFIISSNDKLIYLDMGGKVLKEEINKTTIITSCPWDKGSYSYCPNCSGGNCGCSDESNVACEINWVVTSSLSGTNPLGNSYDGDHDSDNVISMEDLFQESSVSSIMSSTAQLGDNGSLSDKIFICEDLILENVNLSTDHAYWTEQITVRNLNIQNNSSVIFEIDEDIEFEKDFQVDLGSTFEVINNE